MLLNSVTECAGDGPASRPPLHSRGRPPRRGCSWRAGRRMRSTRPAGWPRTSRRWTSTATAIAISFAMCKTTVTGPTVGRFVAAPSTQPGACQSYDIASYGDNGDPSHWFAADVDGTGKAALITYAGLGQNSWEDLPLHRVWIQPLRHDHGPDDLRHQQRVERVLLATSTVTGESICLPRPARTAAWSMACIQTTSISAAATIKRRREDSPAPIIGWRPDRRTAICVTESRSVM